MLFVGESNVCRSVLAVALMRQLLQQAGLDELVECEAKGTRDYNLGEPPEVSTRAAAQQLGWGLPPDCAARCLDPVADIVAFDLLLVMDKFTAADVLREVSGYDLINRSGQYSEKVRLLGEFHPLLTGSNVPGAQDIDDPLYGNVGGAEEEAAVLAAAALIEASCRGLVQWLLELKDGAPGGFPARLKERVNGMERIQWMVPPMLQPRSGGGGGGGGQP